jgi:hypothetical protein
VWWRRTSRRQHRGANRLRGQEECQWSRSR